MALLSLDHSRGRAVFIVTTTTFVLASIFVAARLVSRFGILRNRTADDWCIILAWVSLLQRKVGLSRGEEFC
jgi:hypothetical protein